jgi:hypothetical protein
LLVAAPVHVGRHVVLHGYSRGRDM